MNTNKTAEFKHIIWLQRAKVLIVLSENVM